MTERLETLSKTAGANSPAAACDAFGEADLRAFAWLRDGMTHYLRACEPHNLEELLARMNTCHDAIAVAFRRGDTRLLEIVQEFIDLLAPYRRQPVYVLMGFHGAILFAGEESGFFEFDSPEMARDKIIEILDLARSTGVALNLEFEVSSLEVLCARFPELHPMISQTLQEGTTEIINTTYSHPYTLLIGAESNIRQFEYGGALYERMYGRRPEVYACSEFAYHPQIPQILKHFGIQYSGLRSRLAGIGPAAPYPVVLWEGLDGSTVRALCHQTNHFVGEYYASIFYKEIFSQLLQARSGSNRAYAVMTALVDHTVEMEDDVEQALRISRFCELVGIHKTYSSFFKDGPEPCGIYNFPFDQFDHAFLVPHEVHIHGHAGRRIKLANGELEKRLLQVEALLSTLMLNGHDMSAETAEIHEIWKILLLNQNHDTFGVPEYRKGQYHRERLFLNKAEFAPYIDAIVDDGESIGEKSLRMLTEGIRQTNALAERALQRVGLRTASEGKKRLRLNLHGQPVDEVAAGLSLASDDTAPATAGWRVGFESEGRLTVERRKGSPLHLEFVEADGVTLNPLRKTADDSYRTADGIELKVQPAGPGLTLELNVPEHSKRLRISGFRPGVEFWRNYPLGAETSRCARFATSDFVWLPGEFLLFSPGNHYYEADLARTGLTDYLHDPGHYQLVFIEDADEGGLAWAGRQAARLRMPVAEWRMESVPSESVLFRHGISVSAPDIHIQALIPGNDEIQMRLLNFGPTAGTAEIILPAGWKIIARIDGYGNPCGEQPENGRVVSLEPWTFGTFTLRRD